MPKSKMHTVRLEDGTHIGYVKKDEAVYLCLIDIAKYINATKAFTDKLKELLAWQKDYIKINANRLQYFVTPPAIVTLIDNTFTKDYAKVAALYAFIKKRYGVECTAPVKKDRFCGYCGKKLDDRAQPFNKYCSYECKTKASLVRYHQAAKEKTEYTRTCPWCLQEFKTTKEKKSYCCERHRILYTRQQKKLWRDTESIYPQEKKCAVCGKTFTATTHNHTTCSLECRYILRDQIIAQNKKRCANCGSVFKPTKQDGIFCSKDCEVEYYQKKNFCNVKELYPEWYRYYKKYILPKTPDFLNREITAEELKKPDYQRTNSILMCLDPYPV